MGFVSHLFTIYQQSILSVMIYTFCSHLDLSSESVNLFRTSATSIYILYLTLHPLSATCYQFSAHFQSQTSQLCVDVYTHRIYLLTYHFYFNLHQRSCMRCSMIMGGETHRERAIINNIHTTKFNGLPPTAYHRPCFKLLCVLIWLLSILSIDWHNGLYFLIFTVLLNTVNVQLSKPKITIYT